MQRRRIGAFLSWLKDTHKAREEKPTYSRTIFPQSDSFWVFMKVDMLCEQARYDPSWCFGLTSPFIIWSLACLQLNLFDHSLWNFHLKVTAVV